MFYKSRAGQDALVAANTGAQFLRNLGTSFVQEDRLGRFILEHIQAPSLWIFSK
jgi:hypothetical protein